MRGDGMSLVIVACIIGGWVIGRALARLGGFAS